MTDNYDQLALSWVRKEINNTLDQAKQGLESFVEDNQDLTQMQFCINCLHQVQGTLQMLGFDGASRLVLEMEHLAENLAKGSEEQSPMSFEVLMRAMLQMPGYLERIESGQKDLPVVLVPLINEVRLVSNLPPVNEKDFFSADTSTVVPPKPVETTSEKDKSISFQENSRKLRAHFQKGLTGIIRGKNVKDCLTRIHKVLLRLESLTEGQNVSRLWWVADGFIFSIAEKSLYKEKEVHLLLGQIDKQIKRLADQGDVALNDEIPAQLLSKLLYFVARSNSKNKRIISLKKEFNLLEALPESHSVKEQQEQLARPDATAMAKVVEAIGEELDSVKDQLDLFVRAEAKDPAQLQALYDSLNRIADTLTILELPIPRDVIREQVKQIQKNIDEEKIPDDASIMDIAGALLFVDANLSNFDIDSFSTNEEETEDLSKIGEERAKETQINDATISLVKVARKNLQLAKDCMIGYITSSFDQHELKNSPDLLNDVLGALKIIEFVAAEKVLTTANNFINQYLLATKHQPEGKYLDALADIVTSVDYYLESTEEGNSKTVTSILHGAKPSQDLLETALENIPLDTAESEKESIADGELKSTASAGITNVIPITQSSAEKEIDESLIDDEVLEIFLEEAEEEIASIEKTLPVWINQLDNVESLTTIRRSFHTLKGSGRLVGAVVIGELSWAAENMLNKVLEDSIPAENPVISILNDCLMILPKLVLEFSKNEAHIGQDIDELIARTEHISKGLNLTDFNFKTETQEDDDLIPTLSDEVDNATEDEPIDPVLLDIFVTEAQIHLKVISDFSADAGESSSVAVTDPLIRALHTLKGSAHMAKVDTIAKIAGPLEKYARLKKGNNQRFEASTIKLLIDAETFLSNTIESLKNAQPIDSSNYSSLAERIRLLKVDNASASSKSIDGQQKNQQLISVFLTDGLDILQAATDYLNELKSSPADADLILKISAELHTFHRGSELIKSKELQKLSAVCESVSRLSVSESDSQKEYIRLLEAGVEELTSMLNLLASDQDLKATDALLDEMLSWIEDISKNNAPEEMDQELVELFVEEADELIETAGELLIRWREHLNSKELNQELRRIYHTLKGSSRMAGAMNLGDLAFSAEEIFNQMVDFGREISTQDLNVVEMATEKLTEMVNVLRVFRWPEAATLEIEKLNAQLNYETPVEPTDEIEAIDVVEDVSIVEEASIVEEIAIIDESKDIETDENSSIDEAAVNTADDDAINSEIVSDNNVEAEEVTDPKTENRNELVKSFVEKETSEVVFSEDTITPAAPIVVSGNVHEINLDEDGLEVLEIYLEEVDELLIALDEAMHQWGEDLNDQEAIDSLQRILHTFKGGARLSDLVVLGDLTHEMETYFEKINSNSIKANANHVNFMLQGYDVIESLVHEVKDKNQMTFPESYFVRLKGLIDGEELDNTFIAAAPAVEPKEENSINDVTSKTDVSDSSLDAEIVSFEKHKDQKEENRKQPTSSDSIRVNSNQLEELVNLAGETSIFRSRLEQQMSVLRYNLDEMNSTVDRLKDQLRNLDIETEGQISYRREISGGNEYEDFDPLEMDRYTRQQELTRSLGESAVDLVNLKDTLDALTSDSETLLLQQGRVNTEMQESLMQTRMTSFESLVPRLRRMIRQISTELGKTVELSISADGEMDRSVLERLIAPLEHMLRNAMDHGIETPEERKRSKKNETGKITISLFREGSEVFIRIKDDGRGLDLEAIRQKAIEKGIITKDTEMSQHELQQLILDAGFSTAETVTQISGRGVGMDVVNSEIKQLGGVIDIDSESGKGSVFTVRLPFTVSVNHALMIQIGDETYAIPLANIEGIVRVSPFELEEYYENDDTKFSYAGIDYSMYYLGKMLGHQSTNHRTGASQPLPVLLLHGADHPTALQVDDLLGSREIVVKSIGSQLSSVSGLSGATIQGDGQVVLILDMPALVRRVDAVIEVNAEVDELVVEDKPPTIMVVDDSITVRKVTTRLLERNDFEVITAKDGVDAVNVLSEHLPDVMLLDIEMPRMDGFELATIIRHDERMKDLPIIMITSRTGEKHRERAEAIGVNQYMGKPYNEVDLLETINGLLSEKT